MSVSVSAEVPAGQLLVGVDGAVVTVRDTRGHDPGWSVAGVSAVAAVAPPVTDHRGRRYQQQVTVHDDVAYAPPQHGLGETKLTLPLDRDTIVLTIL